MSVEIDTARIVVLLVAAQRLGELVVARRNTARLLAEGGIEHGAGHYPLIVLLHAGWLLALALRAGGAADFAWLSAFLVMQAARLWVLASLGRYWTTRVITLPQAPLVRRGPYRWMRHPNYLVVAFEIPLLALAFGLPWEALGFGAANVALLAWRVHVEERALAGRRGIPGG